MEKRVPTGHEWACQQYRDEKDRFRALVAGFTNKVAKKWHIAKGLRALSRVRGIDLELQHGSRKVLHCRDLPSMTVNVPHGRAAAEVKLRDV